MGLPWQDTLLGAQECESRTAKNVLNYNPMLGISGSPDREFLVADFQNIATTGRMDHTWAQIRLLPVSE